MQVPFWHVCAPVVQSLLPRHCLQKLLTQYGVEPPHAVHDASFPLKQRASSLPG